MRRNFNVSLEVPDGCTIEDVEEYIRDAVVIWRKGMDPAIPITGLDGDKVFVSSTAQHRISLPAALEFIENSDGKIFGIKFVKRTTGELRQMVARTGVKSKLAENPTKPGIDFKKNNLIPVYDMQKEEYRSISKEGIVEIMIKGEWHAVDH